MNEGPFLLAVDGGQTATKSLLATVDGRVLGAGLGGPSDHFHIEGGVEKNRRAIHGAIDDVVIATGIDRACIVAAGLGLTGAPTGGQGIELARGIVQECLPESTLTVTPDYVTNLAGASGGKSGIVLIAGGGAIGYGITDQGQEAIASGFGFLLGDEGSAFWIGKQAIAVAARAADHRGDPTLLQSIVIDHFGVTRVRELPSIVYAAGFSRERISLLAPKIVQAAGQDDIAAIGILRNAGEELARTALGVSRQLFTSGTTVDVYMTGGVFQAGPFVLEPFRALLAQEWPTAVPQTPRFPPAVGGLIVAARSVGIVVDYDWLATIAATLPTVQRQTR